ncbi:hypothetical protein ATCC90586_011078 [Pythium insidiosum]|nr:hypothetical protein ATCC90586_011078 [Pythium insidiosum]
MTLTQVLHVPGLDKRLISVSALTEKGVEVHFKSNMCVIAHEGKALIRVPRVAKSYTVHTEAANRVHEHAKVNVKVHSRDRGDHGDIFGDVFDDTTDQEGLTPGDESEDAQWDRSDTHTLTKTNSVTDEERTIWHERLIHVGDSRLADIVRACDGVPAGLVGHKAGALCDGCLQGKMCVSPFPCTDRTMVKTTALLEVVHSDVMGPMRVPSYGKAKYAVIFVDDYSRLIMIYFMKSKSEVLMHFKIYKTWIENQLNARIKCIRTDNGGEYVNRKFDTFCQQQGIVHQLTVPYTPQQNGVAERMNRTIVDATRSAMIHRNMDWRWWAEVMAAVVHVLNRIPSTVRPGRSPFEICFKKRPSLGHLRVIGSKGFAHIDKSKRGKLEPKAFRCMLLGYSEVTKGYRVWNMDANKLEVVRSVVLQEIEQPQFMNVVPDTAPTVVKQDDDEDVVLMGSAVPTDPNDTQPMEPKRQRLLPPSEHANVVGEVPPSYGAAMQSDDAKEWGDAVQRELAWVFALKHNDKGEIVRFKARLVAQGFSQAFGVDYNETYSPVATLNSIRILLALCCQLGYVVHQCDVETAFLHGKLKETIYMRVPEGVKHEPGEVCRLKRSLYGLKQASAVWHRTITEIFKQLGFGPCVSDPCIFVKHVDGEFVYISLYVDDLLIAAKDVNLVQEVKDQLKRHFKMKDLGPAKFVIGMEIEYHVDSKVLTIKQSQFIRRLVDKYNQADAAPIVNPCDKGQLMTKLDTQPSPSEQERMSRRPYRSLIGSLQYLAMGTRPDIAYAVSFLSRFAEQPREVHWNAAIRIVRYLKSTVDLGITYKGNGESVTLAAWSDSDWASDANTRRSTTGLMLTMNGGPVVFKSKLQRTVALSTAEAEYMAISMCTQEVLWARTLLEELGHAQTQPTKINTDNKSAIAIAKNVGYSARAKHVDIRYHFVRAHIAAGAVDLQYVPSASQLADFLTKPIEGKTFQRLVSACGLKTTS